MFFSKFITVLATIVVICRAGFEDCTYDTLMGATFELTDLVRTGDEPSYSVSDGDLPCTESVEKNYTYLFNICRDVSGTIPMACPKSAAALQIDQRLTYNDPHDDWCYTAGRIDTRSKMELIDSADPSKGLRIVYYGDDCSTDEFGNPVATPRKFSLEFSCDAKLTTVPVHAYEYKHCQYTVSVPSIAGCPVECLLHERKLCNDHGHCGYDTDKRSAHCYCDAGYVGDSCLTESEVASASSSGFSQAMFGLIMTLFVISVLLVGSILYMVYQVRAYKMDAAHYMALHGDRDSGV